MRERDIVNIGMFGNCFRVIRLISSRISYMWDTVSVPVLRYSVSDVQQIYSPSEWIGLESDNDQVTNSTYQIRMTNIADIQLILMNDKSEMQRRE